MDASPDPAVPLSVQAELPRLWVLFDRRRSAMRDVAIERMNQIPVFAALWASIPDDIKELQEAASNERTRKAFIDGDWAPFIAELRVQGRMYARSDIALADWYRLVQVYREVLLPAVLQEYGGGPTTAPLLLALDYYVDVAMMTIGEAYLAEKSEQEARASLALRSTVSELRRSNRDLDNFAYVASHDLKAPLRDIDNLSAWIVEDMGDALAEGTQRHINLLRDRVARMERLLDDLLSYSRAGRVQDQLEAIELRDAIENARAQATVPTTFRVIVGDGMPRLRTARPALEQVLRNLMGNAVKHHDLGVGTIEIACSAAGESVLISVIDDGPGIPAEYHERVFQMFQTLRPRDEVEGSGMGLAIVRKLVEGFGGHVVIESPPAGRARGTAIRFSWPREGRPLEAA